MPKKLQRKVAVQCRPAPSATASGAERSRVPLGGRRVTARTLTEFTNQLAVLLDAGIPVTRSLRVLEGQLPQGGMRRTAHALVEDVEGGTSLSEAMAKHPKVFDDLYTNMVRAGEAGGIQEEILGRLASFMEKSETIRAKVKGALAYPVMILVVMIAVLIVAFAFVIPKFQQLLERMRVSHHWTTEVVLGLGEHLESWWWAWVVGAVMVYGLHHLLVIKAAGYRRFRDSVVLGFPLFGQLARKTLVARFARTFGTLVQSGVPHLEALTIVGASMGNVHMRDAVRAIHSSIREGAGIAIPMGESGLFDDMVVNMVDVGEQTGELDRMLVKVAERFETDVDRTVDTVFKVIEPILLVLMALVVGFVVFALFTPLLQMMNSLRSSR